MQGVFDTYFLIEIMMKIPMSNELEHILMLKLTGYPFILHSKSVAYEIIHKFQTVTCKWENGISNSRNALEYPLLLVLMTICSISKRGSNLV